MLRCKNGHEFSETEGREIFKDGLRFPKCPFCDELIPYKTDKFSYVVTSLKEHELKLDEISHKLESLAKKLEERKRELKNY